jgi:hypothetical protein
MIPVHVVFHPNAKKEECTLMMHSVPCASHIVRFDDKNWRVVGVRWECQSGHDTYTPILLLAETTQEW